MQERHSNRRQYFKEQSITTEKYVIPYIEKIISINENTKVLEVGCGEGGNLLPFIERGCPCVGIDLNEKQIKNAAIFIKEATPKLNIKLISQDIYDIDLESIGKFDLVFMRDVIEHIHDQEKFMKFLKQFLKPEGRVFFGFPPWWMPFGGHQQICGSMLLSKLPFFHLLPKSLYHLILKSFGEKKATIDSLLEIKDTGITINRFERILKEKAYHIEKKDFYFINPHYEAKFGLSPRLLAKGIDSIPYIRDFFTTCYYCVVKMKPEHI